MPARNLSGSLTASQQADLQAKAMSGDIVLKILPATTTRAATAAAWTRKVTISAETASGQRHQWLNAAYATKLAISDTSTLGTATIASTTLTLVDGYAEVVVTGSAHAWVAAETNTLTVGDIAVMGYTVAGGTSVETIV
jgi:hypothetical protein